MYGNRDTLARVVEALHTLQTAVGVPLEGVFVVDGSPDDSAEMLRSLLARAPFASQLLCHSRNFGAFAAIRSGLLAAQGDYVAVLAADLQEPIELIATMYEKLRTGDYDIAVGTRLGRDDPMASRLASRTFWAIYRRLVDRQLPAGGVDIFACTRQVADVLGRFSESNSSLIGQLFWMGFRRVEVPYSRRSRAHGQSAWTFRKKFRYLSDSVFSFTHLPIASVLVMGLVGTVLALIAAFLVFCAWLIGAIDVPGYTATMLVLLLGTSSILSALGLVGTYVWRTYENTKSRPSAIVMSTTSYLGTVQEHRDD